jgi:hypothetical protein
MVNPAFLFVVAVPLCAWTVHLLSGPSASSDRARIVRTIVILRASAQKSNDARVSVFLQRRLEKRDTPSEM